MTYHPRWRSTTGEPVFLTEPSFMLIVPQQARVELVYGDTLANTFGRIGSILAVALLLCVVILNPSLNRLNWIKIAPQSTAPHPRAARNWTIAVALIVATSATAWWVTPDRAFFAGHELLAKKDYTGAATQFEQAAQDRTYRASKAEALFWAARSYDMGADHTRAINLYEAFRQTYPETYSYPESAYRLIVLYQDSGQHNEARRVLAELRKLAPGNKWTEKAEVFLGPS
jgi:tetratricopeptide (TPR) repeat protein